MNDRIDSLITKLGNMIDQWITDFEAAPVRTTIKVIVILYAIKWAKRNLL